MSNSSNEILSVERIAKVVASIKTNRVNSSDTTSKHEFSNGNSLAVRNHIDQVLSLNGLTNADLEAMNKTAKDMMSC